MVCVCVCSDLTSSTVFWKGDTIFSGYSNDLHSH